MKKAIVLAASVAVVASAVAATAYFTGQTSVPENIIRAGTVEVSAEPTQSALSIDSLAPGETTSRELAVANDGSLPCTVVITAAKKAGITAFFEALSCRATCDGTVLYDGPISGLRTAPLTLAPRAAANVHLAVGLPGDAGNDLEGDYVKMTLYVDAEQVH
ncbi:MAG: CalY family protein [Coriobacteriia bacterium]|nr:CalY family protein [Coriobacteriia bacterium]